MTPSGTRWIQRQEQVRRTSAEKPLENHESMFDDDVDEQVDNEIMVDKTRNEPNTWAKSRQDTKTEADEAITTAVSINGIDVDPVKQPYKYQGEYAILADGDLWAVE